MRVFILLFFFGSLSLAKGGGDGFRMTYDLTGSVTSNTSTTTSGSNVTTTDRSYSEAAIGVNAFFSDWFVWRNAGFGRFSNGVETTYGLDTSFRLNGDIGDKGFSIGGFFGPGYRFLSTADNAPFAEAGLRVHLGGLAATAGVKRIFNSVTGKGLPEETQYFLSVSGGGRLN